MQILEHQSLFLQNLISYKLHLSKENLPFMIKHILKNVDSLGVKISNKILFTEHFSHYQNMEILIPVNTELKQCEQYEQKAVFKLINAVSIRHEGNFSEIEATKQKLLDYTMQKSYQTITIPYYSIVRLDAETLNSCIVDIYIGINYNIL